MGGGAENESAEARKTPVVIQALTKTRARGWKSVARYARRGVDEDTPPICPPFSDPIPRPNATLPSHSIEAMARVQTG